MRKIKIGTVIKPPDKACKDANCPWHGKISVRGRTLQGIVVSEKMQKTVKVEFVRAHYVQKYERFEKRRTRVSAHNPECINAKLGDRVRIGETRSISKEKHFVVLEVLSGKKKD